MTSVRTDRPARPHTTARLRADAIRNRGRIVDAAREAIVEFGPDVPLDEVARRAGVGNATLYRHFADRRELIRQVVLSVMDRAAQCAEDALVEEPDAFAALRRFAFGATEEYIGALCPMISEAFDRQDPEIAARVGRLENAVTAITERAQHDGLLRDDIGYGDLMLSLAQLARPLPGTGCGGFAPFAHRHLQLLLDGLRAPARSVLEGAPVTLEGLRSCHK